MNVTIIADDGAVYVDGFSYSGLDLSFLDPSIHAVQWKGSKGWIEYKENDDGTKPGNEPIEDFSQFQLALDMWNSAKTASEAPLMPAENQPMSTGTQTI